MGPNSVTVTVTDASGATASCVATVTVVDNTNPTAVCQSVTVELDETGSASISTEDIDGGSSDNCGISTITASLTTFDCSNLGDNTVTLTVTDASGNSSTCDAVVTVKDVTAPTAACKSITITLSGGSKTISAAEIDNGSSDNCGVVSMVLSKQTFTCADAGDNTVTLTVTDAAGNSSTCDATVTVANVITGLNAGNNVTVYYGTPATYSCTTLTATPTGGSGVTYSWSPGGATTQSISVCPSATTVYTVTATDEGGCSKTATVKVCVIDVRCGNNLNKVTVCHYPPGNPNNAQTICIAQSALATHLSSNPQDLLGACGINRTCQGSAKESIPLAGEIEISDAVLQAKPSIFDHGMTINFMLATDDYATARLYDMTGKEVVTLFNGLVDKNEMVYIDFNNGSELPQGAYILELSSKTGVRKHLIVTHIK
jgi:hypothetical protein